VLFMQCQRYHHGLLYPILSLGLWRGGNVTLVERWLLTASDFVEELYGFLGRVLGRSDAVVRSARLPRGGLHGDMQVTGSRRRFVRVVLPLGAS
jgi:hypothetical protein